MASARVPAGDNGARMQHDVSTGVAWQRAFYVPLTVLAWLALLVVLGWLLGYVAHTILLIVIAAVIAFALAPIASLLGRWSPRPAAIGLAYLLGVAIILGVGAFVADTAISQISALASSLPRYADQSQNLSPSIVDLLAPLGVTQDTVVSFQQQALAQVQSAGTTVARGALSGVATIAGTVVDLILVVILSIYFASNGPRIAHWLSTETPDSVQPRTRLLVAIVNRVIGGYVRGVLSLAVLVGVLVGAGMGVLGVPYPALLGVLAFFMEFIPVLGVFISGAASLILALIRYHDVLHVVLVLVYFAIVHVLEGDVVGPRIMGKAVGIHPATGLIALLAGTELFGVWGALFAAPIAGLLQSTIVAAWLEIRGGDAQTILKTVAENEDDKAQETVQEISTSDGALGSAPARHS